MWGVHTVRNCVAPIQDQSAGPIVISPTHSGYKLQEEYSMHKETSSRADNNTQETCWEHDMLTYSHESWDHGIASQNNDSPCREHSLKVHQVNNMFICSFFKAWFTRSASLFTQAFSKSLHILNEWKPWSRLTPYYLKCSDVFGILSILGFSC